MQKQKSLMRRLFGFTLSRYAGRVFFVFWRSLLATPDFFIRAYMCSPRPTRVRKSLFTPKLAFFLIWVVLLIGMFVNLAKPVQTWAATSNGHNFQARLESSTGAIVGDGYYNVEFKLYSASSGGSAEWTEDYTYNNGNVSCTGAPNGSGDCRVDVVNGYLTANLGSLTSFSGINWDQQQWLTMNIGTATGGVGVDSGAITWDGEMNPRLQLTAVPYAFRAGQLADPANTGSTLTWVAQGAAHSLQLPNESGTLCSTGSVCAGYAPGSGSGSYIQNGTSMQPTANFNIQSAAIGSVAAVIQG